jgi:hypothetical protein
LWKPGSWRAQCYISLLLTSTYACLFANWVCFALIGRNAPRLMGQGNFRFDFDVGEIGFVLHNLSLVARQLRINWVRFGNF